MGNQYLKRKKNCLVRTDSRTVVYDDIRARYSHSHFMFGGVTRASKVRDSKTAKNLFFVFFMISHLIGKMHSFERIFLRPRFWSAEINGESLS